MESVYVVRGGTVELLCQIKGERNDPSKSSLYQKQWNKVKSVGHTTNVYWYTIQSGSTTKYDQPGTAYSGRATRKTGSHDVVQLKNVTDQDGGTYMCDWDVISNKGSPSSGNEEFTVTVIGKSYDMHI